MPVKINGSTSGSVTLAAPASGSDVTLTLPVQGFGKVLQVVYGSTTTRSNIASTSYTDTTLSATITPSSTSSKVVVFISQNLTIGGATGDYRSASIKIVRGSTDVFESQVMARRGTVNATSGDLVLQTTVPLVYLDSPASTSAVTYKTQGKINDATNSSADFQTASSAPSTVILVEVAA